jgi:hypothetical protein
MSVWNEQTDDALMVLVLEDRTISNSVLAERMAQRFGLPFTKDQVQKRRLRLREGNVALQETHISVDVDVRRSIGDLSLWELREETARRYQDEHTVSGYFPVSFFARVDKPVAIVLSSDWHIGPQWTQYDKLQRDLDLVGSTDGAYLFLAGDLIENAKRQRKSGGVLYDMITANPDEQEEWLDYKVQPLIDAGKVLGYIAGNHERFDRQESGREPHKQWCSRRFIEYYGNGGTFRFDVGRVPYYGVIRHKFPGASGVNTTNNQRRVFEAFPRPREAAHLDFIYLGHLHFNDLHQSSRATGDCVYIRGGSYAGYSEYADEQFGNWSTQAGSPTLIFYPEEQRVIPFNGKDLDKAMKFLRMERES